MELGPELAKRSKVDNVSNLFSSAVESIEASEKKSQDLQLFLIKNLVQSLATTMILIHTLHQISF